MNDRKSTLVKTEALINGKRISYDACDGRDLKTAKSRYPYMKYIGSGKIIYINGRERKFTIEHHFFINKKRRQ